MKKFQRWFEQLGIDGIIIVILAVVAIALSIFDAISGGQISTPLLVSILSLLVLEAVLRRIRLETMKDEIIGSLKGVRVKTYLNNEEFRKAKYKLISQAENSIYDTELCQPPKPGDYVRTQVRESKSRRELNNRIME